MVKLAILDTAKRLLLAEGPGALTVRRISGEVGCSTKVIYTIFGGKDGLSEALWLEGFARFERRLLAVPVQEDPLAWLHAALECYRAYALDEPDYYRVMFQHAMPVFRPSVEAMYAGLRTFDILIRGVESCLRAGRLRGGSAEEIANVTWMAIHGAVSLEISGFIDASEAEPRFRLLYTSVLTPFLGS
jgi:AcrR family transcriptional regulator